MNFFFAELVTPEREFFSGEIVSLTVEASDGMRQFLAHHMPMVVSLTPGVMVLDDGKTKRKAAYSQGFLEVRHDMTVMLCQTMEWPEEIEENRVRKNIEEQERKLRTTKDHMEYRLYKAGLARAFARLRVIR